MPSLSRRLESLRVCDPASRAAFLAGAVAGARPDERAAIFLAAAATGDPAALASVIRHVHRLGETGAAAVCGAADRHGRSLAETLAPAATLALNDRRARTALNVIDVIAHAGAAALTRPLAGLLEDDDEVARRAAETLLAIAVSVVGPDGRAPTRRLARRDLDRAVTDAVRTYRRHRQRSTLLAAALLAGRPGPALTTLLAESDHPAVTALRGLGGRTDEPLVRGNLIRWLGVDPLRPAAQRWLHAVAGTAPEETLADAHLLLAPRRRRALRGLDRPLACLPGLPAATTLSPRGQIGLALLAARLDLSANARCRYLGDLIALPSTPARLRAVGALLGRHGRHARIAVEPSCYDRSTAVARLAASAVLREGDPDRLRRLEQGAAPAVARRASARLAGLDVESFLARWRALPDGPRAAAAVRLRDRDHRPLVAAIRAELVRPIASGEDDRAAVGLIVLARRLRLVPAIESALYTLVTGPARLASAAVAALGDGAAPARFRVLDAALEHDNERVRANALEALARSARPELGRLVRTAVVASTNRLRANGVRALLRLEPGPGCVALLDMLADTSPLHRVSGLWVARRARAVAARSAIERLARRDPIPEIRLRADAVLRGLTRPRDRMTALVPAAEAVVSC